MGFSLLLATLLGAPMASAVADANASSTPVDVVGWPLPDLTGAAPALEVGDDAVYGRQVCPALTRLNLAQKKSEELLLRHAVEEYRDPKRGSAWRLELRQGLYWWGGQGVTAADVAAYLQANLPAIVQSRGGGVWPVPEFSVEVETGSLAVTVRFAKAPAFGPFVLNGAPLYRKASDAATNDGMAYECAGLYRPHATSYGVVLVATASYKQLRPEEIRLYKDGAAPTAKAARAQRIELRYANSLGASPDKRSPDAGSGCARTLDLPLATMIIWNPNKAPTAKPAFRKVLTQLVPRGALAASGAGALADVASAPVPRQHPGYNTQISTRPFDIHAASVQLNALGYRRKTSSSPRLGADGEPLKLLLETQAGSSGLAEKVIADAYSAIGIAVVFRTKSGAETQVLGTTKDSQVADSTPADGVLAAFSLDWPRVSFLANLHSAATAAAPFWPLGDKELDHELEAYAASLTTTTPDFGMLGHIHKRLAELEPITVLLQHKACVDTGSAFKLAKGSLNQRDPDWFREIIL